MWRIKLLFFLLLLSYGLIAARLAFWQIVSGESLSVQAEKQYYQTLILPAKRGEIKSSDNFPLVGNEQSYLLFAEKRKINDPFFSQKIANLLEMPVSSISAKLDNDLVWVPLAHKISSEKAEKIKQTGLSGIGLSLEPSRFYPEASMAAQLLGFVGADLNGIEKGYFGLEGYYDRELRGKEGKLREEKDIRGRPILFGVQEKIKAIDGRSLNLYLDRNLQFMIEEKLNKAIQTYGAKDGSVIVMDPATGGIIAMANTPSFDPRTFSDYETNLYKNPLISDYYEPGSTFKTVVAAAAIDQRLISADSVYQDNGPVTVADYSLRTWNDQYHGAETVTEIIQHSCNTGMVWVGKKLGLKKMLVSLQKFGFTAKTGIDLEGEAEANLRPQEEWGEIDLATASFGQGIAVTPLQMLTAVSVFANGGKLLKPAVVSEVVESSGKKIKIEPQVIRQVIKPETAEIVKEMMVNAVEKGEAKWAKPAGYRIAGKTGTAQIPLQGHYDPNRTIASFVGFAPAEKPKFVMLVRLTEPSSSPWAAETAAPLFFEISKEILNYYNLPPAN